MDKIIIPYGYQPDIAIGYGTLDKIMSAHENIVIIDIRDVAVCPSFPAWNGRNLQAYYGKRQYIHVPELGNVNHKKEDRHKGFALRDQRAGLDRLVKGLEQGYTLILLCGCRSYEHCHRSLVVQLLAAEVEGLIVQHPEEIKPVVASQTMKALSIRQPWCYLIGSRFKDVENRDWPTKYRGQVLLHAGTKIDADWFDNGKMSYRLMSRYGIIDYGIPESKADYPTQSIIGVAEMVACVKESDSRWFSGEFGFVFSHANLFKTPIPYKGQLNFFDVPLDVVSHELEQIGKPDPEVHTPIDSVEQAELFAMPAKWRDI